MISFYIVQISLDDGKSWFHVTCPIGEMPRTVLIFADDITAKACVRMYEEQHRRAFPAMKVKSRVVRCDIHDVEVIQ